MSELIPRQQEDTQPLYDTRTNALGRHFAAYTLIGMGAIVPTGDSSAVPSDLKAATAEARQAITMPFKSCEIADVQQMQLANGEKVQVTLRLAANPDAERERKKFQDYNGIRWSNGSITMRQVPKRDERSDSLGWKSIAVTGEPGIATHVGEYTFTFTPGVFPDGQELAPVVTEVARTYDFVRGRVYQTLGARSCGALIKQTVDGESHWGKNPKTVVYEAKWEETDCRLTTSGNNCPDANTLRK